MTTTDLQSLFTELTGSPPFRWQSALYGKFAEGHFPRQVSIPTGLGKTSVVTIWLIALALCPDRVPRRLVYVVNRRTVVDQTTTEVLRLCDALTKKPELAEVRAKLTALAALPLPRPDAPPLAVSTLRGQFADNGDWCADPARPAVVIGTVDMIGSGLLFSRYTRGFKARPLHAGFLGQDVLLVHDEAHLEPSFQKLLESIVAAQSAAGDPHPLRLLELTATSRAEETNDSPPFTLTEADLQNESVAQRINATKTLSLITLRDDEKLEAKIVALAKAKLDGRATLIFIRSVQTALKIATELDKGDHRGKVAVLTGTIRGRERDELVSKNPVFQRFLAEKDRAQSITTAHGTVYLVATSAGEVGINISADDLICDLSTYESMAQRFGRVNRFGLRDDSEISVIHEATFESEKPLEAARERTLALLKKLDGSASPAALAALPPADRAAAFSPPPKRRVATDIQFDAWALTSIREPIAARPPVAPYLHGEAEWQPPETHLAWRDDRDFQHIPDDSIEDFLETFPLAPGELLRDTTSRIVKTLDALLSKRAPEAPALPDAWLLDESGFASRFPLSDFDKDTAESVLSEATLILPTSLGGLDAMGIFSTSAKSPATDCSGIERRESHTRDVAAAFSCEISGEDAEEPRYLLWFESANACSSPRKIAAGAPETLDAHTQAVTANAAAIAAKLFPDRPVAGEPDLARCLIVAARLHDLGKSRSQWQRNLGNLAYDPANPETIFAKSGGRMRPRNVREHYRHEFGSLLDAESHADFTALNEAEREITLHIVAAHHGRARPHFPIEEAFDYSGRASASCAASETPLRFARLQKRFGRWGLAWLESLLRAADYAASAGTVAQALPETRTHATESSKGRPSPSILPPTPSATLALNPANPGHFFACCGLFELAARPGVHPEALAWFEQDPATRQWHFRLANTEPLVELLERIIAAELKCLDEADNHSPVQIGDPFSLRLDWWRYEDKRTGRLKTWAGRQGAFTLLGILLPELPNHSTSALLKAETIATRAVSYFDAERRENAAARDVGFSRDRLKKGGAIIDNVVHPAVEFFALIGIQRTRASLVRRENRGDQSYYYHLWTSPAPITLLPAAATGFLPNCTSHKYRFTNPSRTEDYLAFTPATISTTD